MDGSSSKVVEVKAHGDVAEEDPARRGGPGTDEADDNEKAPRRSRRVASLDVFRGLTVAVSSPLSRPARSFRQPHVLMAAKVITSTAAVGSKVSEVVHNCKSGIEKQMFGFFFSPPGCYYVPD